MTEKPPTGPVKWPAFERVIAAVTATLQSTAAEIKRLQQRAASTEQLLADLEKRLSEQEARK